VLDVIAARVSPSAFSAWFRNTYQVNDDGTIVSIEVPDQMSARWLTAQYQTLIDESFAAIGRTGTTTRILVAGRPTQSSS